MTTRLAVRLTAAVVLVTLTVVVLLLTRSQPSAGDASPAPASAPRFLPAASAQPAPPPSTASDQEPTSAPTAAPSTPPSAPTTTGSSETEAAALEAVNAWQADTDQQRTDALATIAITAFQDAALTIDATRVPRAAPTTARTRVEADGQALVDVELEDGTNLALVLVVEEDRWLLADLRPVLEPDDGGGAP